MPRGTSHPDHPASLVLLDAHAGQQKIREARLSRSVFFHGSALEPLEGLAFVPRHTFTLEIKIGNVRLSRWVSLIGGLKKPAGGLGRVRCDSLAQLQRDPEFHLVFCASLLRARQRASHLRVGRHEGILARGP